MGYVVSDMGCGICDLRSGMWDTGYVKAIYEDKQFTIFGKLSLEGSGYDHVYRPRPTAARVENHPRMRIPITITCNAYMVCLVHLQDRALSRISFSHLQLPNSDSNSDYTAYPPSSDHPATPTASTIMLETPYRHIPHSSKSPF